jgi:hypothetical protein
VALQRGGPDGVRRGSLIVSVPIETIDGIRVAALAVEASMPDDDADNMTTVPIPASETEAEHRRIRSSNDRDQQLEREGKVAPHNRGYDEAADGAASPPPIERVVDE